jgi:hypothetical protein
VTIYEIELADGIDFFVMEYLPGQTLDGLSRRAECARRNAAPVDPDREHPSGHPYPKHRSPQPQAGEL